MTPRRLLFLFLGAITGLRLLFISLAELSPDEAYYYMWSQRLDYCYFSKGPGVAVAIWIGTHLFGPNEFGIRFFSPLLALGTSLLLFWFARRLYGESVAIWTVLVFSVVPIFAVGTLVMTIDPLSLFFWMAALCTFWRALEKSPEGSAWWPATGLLMGLGFLCKWINALQYVSIILLLLCNPRHRREFARAGFWSLTALFGLCTVPPILWNARHDWITIHHLTVRGHLEKAFHLRPGEFLLFLGLHFGVYSPLLFAGFLLAIWWGWREAQVHLKPRFLLAFALPVLALYFWLSLTKAGEPNWTAPAFLSLGVLAVALWHERCQVSLGARRYAIAALASGLALSTIILNTDLLRRAGLPLSYESDPSARVRGWISFAKIASDFQRQFEAQNGAPVFLIGDKYQTAAELCFYMRPARPALPGHPAVYTPESQDIESEFSLWPRYDESVDLVQFARDYLGAATGAASDAAAAGVRNALEALVRAEASPGTQDAEARRALVRALRVAAPQIPLDEASVEDEGPALFAGRTALYITDRPEDRAPTTIQRGFERTELISCVDLERAGFPLRQLRIFACYNYHGMSL